MVGKLLHCIFGLIIVEINDLHDWFSVTSGAFDADWTETSLRKSAPGPPNISDSCVSCIAPAARNASLQTLFKCPTLANVFGTAAKPSHFTHFRQGAEFLARATRNHT